MFLFLGFCSFECAGINWRLRISVRANYTIRVFWRSFPQVTSWMYKANRTGPSALPWGTPGFLTMGSCCWWLWNNRACVASLPSVLHASPHTLHVPPKGSTQRCNRECFRMLWDDVNDLSHTSHRKGRSPVCTRVCIISWLSCRKDLSHEAHWCLKNLLHETHWKSCFIAASFLAR